MLQDVTSEWYGRQLAREAGLRGGTIYPALARLEQNGWLESHWEEIDPREAGRPARRLYKLTEEGAERAREAVSAQASLLVPVAPIKHRLAPGLGPSVT